jgi:hypothetical protein
LGGIDLRRSFVAAVTGIASRLDIAAIVLGALALKQTSRELKKERLMAHIGLWAGLVRLIAATLMFLWVIIAFARNPVAH